MNEQIEQIYTTLGLYAAENFALKRAVESLRQEISAMKEKEQQAAKEGAPKNVDAD